MKLKVGLLGGGSWGTTVASLTSKNSETTLWARDADTVKEINEVNSNETKRIKRHHMESIETNGIK